MQLPYNKSELKDSMGRFRTASLFYEINQTDIPAIFTLKEEDTEYKGKLHLSMKRLYLEMCDPTEYIFATTILFSYPQWERMVENSQIAPHIESWRKELNLYLKAMAVQKNIQLSKQGSYNATKWLSDRGWQEAERGRPTEKERQARLKEDREIIKQLEEDSLRLVQNG